MTDKKELAEQIKAEQIYDKNISTIYKEHLEFNTRFKGEIIAAIIEAMNLTDSRPTDEEITEKAIQYSKQFEIRDKPIESEINRSRAVRDYYAGYKDAINNQTPTK